MFVDVFRVFVVKLFGNLAVCVPFRYPGRVVEHIKNLSHCGIRPDDVRTTTPRMQLHMLQCGNGVF